jgi:hypothetical protein
MGTKCFGLIGDGFVASHHKKAISMLATGSLLKICDPKYEDNILYTPDHIEIHNRLTGDFFDGLDYVVICSPTYRHQEHIKKSLQHNCEIIVEKPMCLPWETMIDDDRINVCLQLNWLHLPSEAETVEIVMIRDENYFSSWKGDAKLTGGLFFNLFIHYIHLAEKLGATFRGMVKRQGEGKRLIYLKDGTIIDLAKLNFLQPYNRMYRDIVNRQKGIKPKDLFYLHWLLSRNSEIYGYGRNCFDKEMVITHELF